MDSLSHQSQSFTQPVSSQQLVISIAYRPSPSASITTILTDQVLLDCHNQQPICLQPQHKKPCIVTGCLDLVAPTMWLIHMTRHAQGILPGSVLASWMADQGLFICPHYSTLVRFSRSVSHLRRCTGVLFSHPTKPLGPLPEITSPDSSLPSFAEVFGLRCPTIRHIPFKSKPAFARLLAATLKDILYPNTKEAWLKLFLLPKFILLSCQRHGRRHKPID